GRRRRGDAGAPAGHARADRAVRRRAARGAPPRRRLGPAGAPAAAGGPIVKRRDLLIGVVVSVAVLLEASLSNQRQNTVAVNLLLYAPIAALFIAQPLRPLEFTLALIVALSLVS